MSTARSTLRPVSRRAWQAALAATAVGVVAMLTAACAGPKPICPAVGEHLFVIPSTSQSDLAIDRILTPTVAAQAVTRTAESCGRLTVGIQDDRPYADLQLQSMSFTPATASAVNPNPVIHPLIARGDAFVRADLLEPLDKRAANYGSPFLGALAKVASELIAEGGGTATVILVGDGLDVEPAPQGDGVIDFTKPTVSARLVEEFVPLLAGLKGSCVMLIGLGATNRQPDRRIRTAQNLLASTLAKAGVGFVATRSPDLPPHCVGAST